MTEARRLLAEYQPEPLPDAVLDEMRSIIHEAETELGAVVG
jgi:trimethylamine:corrinoid methyltransferase-like protein